MFEWILALDTRVFQFLNVDAANPVTDFVMPVITNQWVLRGVLALIVVTMLIRGGKRGRIAAAFCILAVALADQISSQVLKPLVERVRPCHVLANVHLLVDCSQGLSFPSSHASNSVAVATFLLPIYPRARWYLVLFAFLVSYSRISVGVHYPLDVICGAVVGIVSGAAITLLYGWVRRQYPSISRVEKVR